MCLIVDASCCGKLFPEPENNYKYVKSCLYGFAQRHDINVKLVIGGQLKKELLRHHATREAIAVLVRGNRAKLVSDVEVDKLSASIAHKHELKSNDSHIIALALLTGARLLISEDSNLIGDFTSGKILSPPGKVYKDRQHDHLLVACCSKPS